MNICIICINFLDQHLPTDQRSLNYIQQLETKVKELEEEKKQLTKKIIQEEKIDQKINNWNADSSFPVSCQYYLKCYYKLLELR